ncbi:MAG: 4Fe-4S dicluster domain-containing protein [Lachnospiraceae bacterium]|nr:4Fe-4S dicluster domain-containing protein [Lachnospiraceae bacterium]
MSTRGIYTAVSDIRKRVFTEIAKLSYNYEEGSLAELEQIPYRIIPGEISTYRTSIFLEREIVKERLRLALGLNLRPVAEHAPVSQGAEECVRPEKYYEPPLINVITFACNACPDHVVRVSDQCQGCLAHPCQEICPKEAIHSEKGRSVIDESKCVKCGKCVEVCPYQAIVRLERPCAMACGVNAIGSDEYGRAKIDQDKCVKCGMCFANCPFGAIADKSQIFQTIQAIRSDTPVYAAIAPAFIGQFGPDMSMKKIRNGFKALGFKDAVEVAIGADLCTIQEAEDFVKEVPDKLSFMGTSCCPAWSSMAKKLLPGKEDHISMALTPMVLTARLIKQQHPNCKVAFIGPCAAKKVEAIRKSVRSEVDFVLTFEEVWGMFEAKEIVFSELEGDHAMHGASGDARGFAVSGGVAEAVANRIKDCYPDVEVKMERAEGLDNCRKMLTLAKAGKYNGYLLEGMACPHGCVGGAGTVQPIEATKKAVEKNKAGSTLAHASESSYQHLLDILTQE